MTDYEGDEQLQDAFEEGNGDATHEEVCFTQADTQSSCSAITKPLKARRFAGAGYHACSTSTA